MKGWRTLAFSAAVALLGVAQAADWTSILGSSPYAGWVTLGIGAAVAALRVITNTPVGQAKK